MFLFFNPLSLLSFQLLVSSLFVSAFSGRGAALCAAVLILGALPGQAGDPVVSNLKAVPREGTKLVDLTYDGDGAGRFFGGFAALYFT